MTSGTAGLLAEAASTLAEVGVPTPRADAELLLAHVLGRSRGVVGAGVVTIDAEAEAAFRGLVARRATRTPLQHLTGQAHFRRVSLEVGPGVFVPRPETEVMVGAVLDRLRSTPDPVVLELGTGSGAIAAALADECPTAAIHAVELDPLAHEYAVRNLAGTGVDLRLADLAAALETFPHLRAVTDVVVANPPYIPESAYESVAVEARDFDPPAALWSGEDGLDAIRALLPVAIEALRPGGMLAFEHAEVQSDDVVALTAGTGAFTAVRDNDDLTGRSRFVTATRSARMGGWTT